MEKYLIISAGGKARVVAQKPRLCLDEFAYRLVVNIPDTWASVLGEIVLNLPDPNPTVKLTNDEEELDLNAEDDDDEEDEPG